MKRLFFFLLGVLVRTWPRPPLVAARIRRIVVVKLCCIGDILFTTPLLRALRHNYPLARITYMVSPWCRSLVDQDPRVDEVIEFDPYTPGTWNQRLARVAAAIRQLRRGRFDVALVLHRTPLAGLMAAVAGIPFRSGFDWQGRGFALNLPVPFRDHAHEVDRYLDCLKPLGAASDGSTLEWIPPATAEAWADQFLRDAAGQGEPRPLVAVFPSGGVNPGTVMTTKRWPAAKYSQVCLRLAEVLALRFVLVGGPDDAPVGDQMLAGAPGLSAIRTEGRTTLPQLGALLKRCVLFIGGDSGPLYLAAAVGIPTVSIFGPTDPGLLAPRGPQHRVVAVPPGCAPCHTPDTVRQDPHRATVCRETEQLCMDAVTPEAVVAAAKELLEKQGYLK